ncbi:MAG: ABC transporter ATP-binding protein [Chelatococcus sp.]|nr:ABC transporter ATP-binding protein [Chelatococcus sp. YT9]MBX3556276.1 ABC transporter ATP-binding protein [Chelatococcus sp.]
MIMQPIKPATPLLEATGLSKQFPLARGFGRKTILRAVDNVTMHINAGETLGLIGESGCGKSTLGRMISQLMDPSSGTIRFDGQDISQLPRPERRRVRQQIQTIFQDPYSSLNPVMTVRDIIAEPLRNFDVAKGPDADRKIREVLDLCGIPASAMIKYPREFSGGQRQRIGIARALVLKPRFIVADEPVSALDVSIQAQIVNFLRDLQREFKLSYLFIGHDMAVVRHISHRVSVMYLGRIVETAPSSRIYADPRHPYTQALLSSVPIPDPAREAKRQAKELKGEIPSPLAPPPGCHFNPRCAIADLAICTASVPPLTGLTPDHQAACHLQERAKVLPAA